ncbi:aminoglycoside adenylyltransferase domain-containing protein [Micromonospora sp. DT31]|uniref:nucleotidyltransferase domain-containing protein n=1 Tax=Micromonospora sp. DT31 TaxID=3393434 RepID=UPI003CFA5FE0
MTTPATSPDAVLADLAAAWAGRLDRVLLGLYAHGSLVSGDFAPERSDLDVLAVLDRDPDRDLLAVLAGLHAGLDRRHPRWVGRVEVEYVSPDAVRDVTGGADIPHRIARVSPGELLHLLPATGHRVVTWAAVHDHGRTLFGPPPGALLPAVGPERVRAALVAHVRDWPGWSAEMTTPGAQSYAVLTVCRAVQRLRYDRQMSKRAAADASVDALPQWADLIRWARDWWYVGGRDSDPGRAGQMRAFVREISATLLSD